MAVQGNVTQLIDDDQVMTLNLFFQLQDLTFFAGLTIKIRQPRGGEEPGLVAATTSFAA